MQTAVKVVERKVDQLIKRFVDRFFTPKTKPATRQDVVFHGIEGASEVLRMYEKHGPLDVLVEADSSQESWPDGVVLVGVIVTDTITFNEGGITLNISWDEERSIRTGIARRIFGP